MTVELRLDGHLVEIPGDGTEPGLRAAAIAAAVDLGPRRRPAAQGLLLFDGDEPGAEDVASVGADWTAAVDALSRAARRRWQLVVEAAVVMDVVDAGDAGLWSVGRDAGNTVWRPVGSEELWSALLIALMREPRELLRGA